jgi:hypothetical protein
MRRYGKFGILGVCLLVFSLAMGSLTPQVKIARAAITCPPPNTPLNANSTDTGVGSINVFRRQAFVVTSTQTTIISPTTPITLPTITQETTNSGIGAQNHAIYLANNPDDFPNNYESTANVCYSSAGDIAAGSAMRFARASSASDAVSQAIDSVYLRLPLLDPRLASVGVGFDTDSSGTGKAVIDTSNALATNMNNGVPNSTLQRYFVGYPGPNTTSVPTTLPQGEGSIVTSSTTLLPRLAGGRNRNGTLVGDAGDPLADVGLNNPAGYPISLQFDFAAFAGTGYTLDQVNSSLSQVSITGTVPISVSYLLPSQIASKLQQFLVGTGTPSTAAFIMIPNQPLQSNATYEVKFVIAFNVGSSEQTKTITWRFKTGTGSSSGGGGGGTGNGSPAPTSIIVPTSAALTPTPTQGLPGAPGLPPNAGPTSFFTPTPADGENPPQFFQVWRRADDPVKYGYASRSWLYGPLPYGFAILYENYEGGRRIVAYHDKARMEITNPNTGYVSNGLLVKEMISGAMQVGDSKYEIRTSSLQTVVGDPFELNPQAPTYASFARVASLNNDKRAPNRTGQQVIETMTRDGTTGANVGTAAYGVTYSYYDPNLGHNIPDRFWRFMNQYGLVNDGGYYNATVFNWVTVMGLPLSEPYWVQATVGGQVKDVLVQVFERRVLTFTPSNTPAFQVEMGNAGRHYFQWRYGNSGP